MYYIPKEIKEEAKKEKDFALKQLKNMAWLTMACGESVRMVQENAKKTVQQIAREKWEYLQMRANAQGKYYGSNIYIDPQARKKYLTLIEGGE